MVAVSRRVVLIVVALGLFVSGPLPDVRAAERMPNVEAFAGEPLGVGRVKLPVSQLNPPGTQGDQHFAIEDKDGRILYPVYSVAAVRTTIGEKGATHVDEVTVWFLFRGNAQLKVSVDLGDSRTTTLIAPAADAEGHKRLLGDWWTAYTSYAGRVMFEDGYPPQVENYLTATLARRLGLQMPATTRPWWQNSTNFWRDDLMSIFGTLLGAESVRIAMQKETLLAKGDSVEKADQPLPAPVAPPAVTLPEFVQDATIEPIARHVPAECFYLRCGSFAIFQWLRSRLDVWGGDLRNLVAVRGVDYEIGQRLERQLALQDSVLSKLLGDTVISDVALIGTDTFFREGAAVGILFQAKKNAALSAAIGSQRLAARKAPGVTEKSIVIDGRKVSFLSAPDNSVRSFYAVDGNFHLVTTSQTIAARFYEAAAGKAALADLDEFRYTRSLIPLAPNDAAFIYLSDPFFRSLVGPRYRVEMTRRMQAEADIELVHLARLAAQAEHQAADTIEQLIAGGFLPKGFGTRPDGSRPVLDGGTVVDSLRGARRAFLPVPDVEIAGLTPSEVRAYQDFALMYTRQWQRVDPVIVGVQRAAIPGKNGNAGRERVTLDVHISPYARTHYAAFDSFLGAPDEKRLAPIEGNLIELELRPGGFLGRSDRDDEFRMFAGIRDFDLRFGVRDSAVVSDPEAWRDAPLYFGETPAVPNHVFGNVLPAEGYTSEGQGSRTWWSYRSNAYLARSLHKSALEAVAPALRLEDAERPAQLRLRIGDLADSKIAPILNAYGYTHARRVSAGDAEFLYTLIQQLRVPDEKSLAAAEAILGAKLACALGGEYKLHTYGPGPVRWRSTAWKSESLTGESRVPEGYRFLLLDWLRGLDLEFSIDQTTLTTHIELELANGR